MLLLTVALTLFL